MRGNQLNKRWALLLGGAIGALVFGAGAANANITYNVNQKIGVGGVTGTITTDGTAGLLSNANFLAWNLNLQGNGASFNLTQSNSTVLDYVSGIFGANSADVTADTHNIYFNFDGTDGGYLGFQTVPYSGLNYWCNATVTQGFDCIAGGETVAPIYAFDPSTQFQGYSGNQIIASVGVPEPSTWAMMLIGVTGLGAMMRRRRSALAVAA